MRADERTELGKRISAAAKVHVDPAGREVAALRDAQARRLAAAFDCPVHEVFEAALEAGVWPLRYVRNRDTVSAMEQLRLARATVAVIGAGGLGGAAILMLARVGVGRLKVVDRDRFDETNLNRQALSSCDNLGAGKAEAAVAAVAAVNPGVLTSAFHTTFDRRSAPSILSGVDVVVDALDNVPDRLTTEAAAKEAGIPLVHGALAGFDAQVMTVFPDDPGLRRIYGEAAQDERSRPPEAVLGVPTVTPFLVASLQVTEVLKILLERGEPLRRRMLHVDLEGPRFDVFRF